MVSDRTNEMWTPRPRCAPEQVRQQKTPNEREAHCRVGQGQCVLTLAVPSPEHGMDVPEAWGLWTVGMGRRSVDTQARAATRRSDGPSQSIQVLFSPLWAAPESAGQLGRGEGGSLLHELTSAADQHLNQRVGTGNPPRGGCSSCHTLLRPSLGRAEDRL